MPPIIRVENLSKSYRIGAREAPYQTLRESVVKAVREPFNAFRHKGSRKKTTIWALKDINLDVQPGEVVGIIGRNGAGKSTLLKILSRVTEPTTGRVDLYGRVGSLLEVGTGFHPELTGRENIFLNGAILGMKRAEIERKFDEIVAFAEVDEFIDTPVKRYSSGMFLRLAFSVAAHLEPEILVVDEVLAVGDASFQRKCLRKMSEVAKEGRTVLFVSHNMGAIQGLCSRAIWLAAGRIEGDGEVHRVVADYMNRIGQDFVGAVTTDSEMLSIQKVLLKDEKGDTTTNFSFGSSLGIEIHYHARCRIEKPYFWISVSSKFGPLFAASMLLDGLRPNYLEGEGAVTCLFEGLSLLPQVYDVSIGVRSKDGIGTLVKATEVGIFQVTSTPGELGLQGELADTMAWNSSPFVVPYQWRLPDGRVERVEFQGRGSDKNGHRVE
jgi:lipopolysaccharide transport system ATP-binding protein